MSRSCSGLWKVIDVNTDCRIFPRSCKGLALSSYKNYLPFNVSCLMNYCHIRHRVTNGCFGLLYTLWFTMCLHIVFPHWNLTLALEIGKAVALWQMKKLKLREVMWLPIVIYLTWASAFIKIVGSDSSLSWLSTSILLLK